MLRAPRGARIDETSRGDRVSQTERTSGLCRPPGQPFRVCPFSCTTTVCASMAVDNGRVLSLVQPGRSRVHLLRRGPVMHQGRFQLLVFRLRQLAG